MIHRLLYLSDICEGYSRDLNKALKGARTYYSEHGITGALWFDGKHFIQLLEGPKNALEAAMKERLIPKHTHCNVKITELPSTGKRRFQDWSMSYLCEGGHAAELIEAYTGDPEFDPHNYLENELADLLCLLERDRQQAARNAIN